MSDRFSKHVLSTRRARDFATSFEMKDTVCLCGTKIKTYGPIGIWRGSSGSGAERAPLSALECSRAAAGPDEHLPLQVLSR